MGEADPLPDPHPGLWVLRPGGKEEASQGASPAPPKPWPQSGAPSFAYHLNFVES